MCRFYSPLQRNGFSRNDNGIWLLELALLRLDAVLLLAIGIKLMEIRHHSFPFFFSYRTRSLTSFLRTYT